jgi:hypothetical protein
MKCLKSNILSIKSILEFKSKRPNYAAEYYREKYACPVRCPYCDKEVIKQKISRHIQKTQSGNTLSTEHESTERSTGVVASPSRSSVPNGCRAMPIRRRRPESS